MKSKQIDRRIMLKGLGSVCIGLPLLEEMISPPKTQGAITDIPIRAFNVFFGLGIPSLLQKEGYEGVLEPLKPLKNKLLIMRDVDQVRCDVSGTNAHFDGATGSFTAMPAGGEAKAGGPSIDQLVKHAYHPNGMPADMVPTLIGGTYFRRSRVGRYLHSYNLDGTVAGIMQEKPRDLFDRVFGFVNVGDVVDSRKRRLKRSVLDSVINQYKYFKGANSPLGSASKTRVSEHLERIREYELRAFELKTKNENTPQRPPRSKILHGGQADPGGQGVDISLKELTNEWRLMAELYALSIKMDRVRFGSITFLAAGERIRLSGDYYYNDRKVFEFNDSRQLNAGGDQGCSHEWWHKFNENKPNSQLRAHAHMKMREVAYFLSLLDAENESNGKTILENSMITISTESGDGRHNDAKRELSGVFHAITSANGRFKTGQILDVAEEGIDVYNTMVQALGSKKRLGPNGREFRQINSILS